MPERHTLRRRWIAERHSRLASPEPLRRIRRVGRSSVLTSTAVLMLCVGSVLFGMYAPLFAIQTIEVRGARLLDHKAIAGRSGLAGQSVWMVTPDAVVAQLQQELPLDNIELRLELPNKAILTVEEHMPSMRWQAATGTALVDTSGRVLPEESATMAVSVTTTIHVYNAVVPLPGERVDGEAVRTIHQLMLHPAGQGLLASGQLNWSPATGLFLRLPDGRGVVFGSGEQLDRKLRIFEAVQAQQVGYTLLDLRPSQPYYRTDDDPAYHLPDQG